MSLKLQAISMGVTVSTGACIESVDALNMRLPISLREPRDEGDDALEACKSMNEPIEVSVWTEDLLRSCEFNTKGLFWYRIDPGLPKASANAGEKNAGVNGAVMLPAAVGDSGADTLSIASRPSFPNRKSPFLT